MVVLECVCALLEKGYLPKTVFLEKEWTLGHTGKGGRADITIYDKDAHDVLFIIECKTYGKEYNRAKKELFEDGAGKQLFSYAAQARSCKRLMLYTSHYNSDSAVDSVQPANGGKHAPVLTE